MGRRRYGRRGRPRVHADYTPRTQARKRQDKLAAKGGRTSKHTIRVDDGIFARVNKVKADRECGSHNDVIRLLLDRYDIHLMMSPQRPSTSTPLRPLDASASVQRTPISEDDVDEPVPDSASDDSVLNVSDIFPILSEKQRRTSITYSSRELGQPTTSSHHCKAIDSDDTAPLEIHLPERDPQPKQFETAATSTDEGSSDSEDDEYDSYDSYDSEDEFWTETEDDLDRSYILSPPPTSDSDAEGLGEYLRHVEFICRPTGENAKHIFVEEFEVETAADDSSVSTTADEMDATGDAFEHVLDKESANRLVNEKCSIAYASCLEVLANLHPITKCYVCESLVTIVQTQVGTAIYLKWVCNNQDNQHVVRRWCSQPRFKYGQHLGDFTMCCATLFTGNNYSKVASLLASAQMKPPSQKLYYDISSDYALPTINSHWESIRAETIEKLQGKENTEVVVLGDGRMDSPGFNAQFCTYTMMDNESKDIVEMVIVDKRQVDGKSTNMEKLGFVTGIEKLTKEDGLNVVEVVTDAHVQIKALLKNSYPDIKHSLDVWHGAKNLSKKIIAAGSESQCGVLLEWVSDVSNHFWHCVQKCDSYQEFLAKWRGLLHHVSGCHEWVPTDGVGTGKCGHAEEEEDTTTSDKKKKTLIEPATKAHYKLRTLILDPNFLSKIEMYLNFRTTSELESFNNQILQYASKRFSFQYPGYKGRCQLAAISYQENKGNKPQRTKTNELRLKRVYRKRSGKYDAGYVKQKTFTYVRDLMEQSLKVRIENPTSGRPRRTLAADDPRRLSLTSGRVQPLPTKEIFEAKRSRLSLD